MGNRRRSADCRGAPLRPPSRASASLAAPPARHRARTSPRGWIPDGRSAEWCLRGSPGIERRHTSDYAVPALVAGEGSHLSEPLEARYDHADSRTGHAWANGSTYRLRLARTMTRASTERSRSTRISCGEGTRPMDGVGVGVTGWERRGIVPVVHRSRLRTRHTVHVSMVSVVWLPARRFGGRPPALRGRRRTPICWTHYRIKYFHNILGHI